MEKEVLGPFYTGLKVNQECQTEVGGTMSRKLDVIILHEQPFKRMHEVTNKVDQTTQTSLTNKVIDFVSNGSKKYELLLLNGMIKASENGPISE